MELKVEVPPVKKKVMKVTWNDGETSGQISNQFLDVGESHSYCKDLVLKNIADLTNKGYTPSEAAALARRASTVSGTVLYCTSNYYASDAEIEQDMLHRQQRTRLFLETFTMSRYEVSLGGNVPEEESTNSWTEPTLALNGAASWTYQSFSSTSTWTEQTLPMNESPVSSAQESDSREISITEGAEPTLQTNEASVGLAQDKSKVEQQKSSPASNSKENRYGFYSSTNAKIGIAVTAVAAVGALAIFATRK